VDKEVNFTDKATYIESAIHIDVITAKIAGKSRNPNLSAKDTATAQS
jgi:hypothetical protein